MLKDAKGMGALAQGLTILPYLTHIYTPSHACRHAQNSAKDFWLPKFGLRGIVSSWRARLQNSLAWPTFGKAQAHAFCKKSFRLVLWTRSCSATFLQNKSPLNHVDSSLPCLDHTWTIDAYKKWNRLKQSIYSLASSMYSCTLVWRCTEQWAWPITSPAPSKANQ